MDPRVEAGFLGRFGHARLGVINMTRLAQRIMNPRINGPEGT